MSRMVGVKNTFYIILIILLKQSFLTLVNRSRAYQVPLAPLPALIAHQSLPPHY